MTDPAALARRNAVVEANLGLVRFFNRRHRTRRGWVDWDDLDQAGTLGLLRAIAKYDPARGPLSVYARAWVRDFANDALGDAFHPFHVPKYARRHEPIVDASEAGLDDLAARDEVSPDRERLDAVWRAVDALREPDRTVIRLRYGEGLLLREVGDRLGRTTERVRQIESRGVRRLRDVLGEAG